MIMFYTGIITIKNAPSFCSARFFHKKAVLCRLSASVNIENT